MKISDNETKVEELMFDPLDLSKFILSRDFSRNLHNIENSIGDNFFL